MRQRGPVSSRTREALAVGSWRTSHTATRSATSGQVQQPGQADDLDRDAARDQRALDLGEVGRAVRHRTAISPGGVPVRTRWAMESASQSISSAWVGSSAQRTRPSRSAPGAGRSASTPSCMRAQRGGEAVGEVEQPAAAAAVLAEREAAGGAAVGVREVRGEVVEVGHGGAAPAVDGLAGVADGGDGVAGAGAEQPGEQQPLGDRGVLVLVEQDDPELRRAGSRPTSGLVAGQRGGQRDLVAEVEQVACALARRGTPRRGRAVRGGRAAASGHLAQRRRWSSRAPSRVPQQLRVVRAQLARRRPGARRARRRARAGRSTRSAKELGERRDRGRGPRAARARRAGSGWRRRAAGRWAPGRCAARGP